MKRLRRILSVFLVLVLTIGVFAGCSKNYELSRASRGLTNYSIDAVFCDSEKKISAIEEVDFINNTETILNSVCFNLYGTAFSEDAKIKPYSKSKMEECFPNGLNYGDMKINSALVNGTIATFNIIGEDNNAVEVLLSEPLYNGERVKILLEFELYLANCTHRLGYNAGKVNLGNWYPIVAVYENGSFNLSPYYANGDPFYSDCANYNVSISYSENYQLFSSGVKEEEVNESGVVKSTFSAKVARDFAFVLLEDAKILTSDLDGTELIVATKSTDENIAVYLETAEKTINLFNELFGEYPYHSLSVVFTDFFQGGMEYPGLVYISTNVSELEEIKKVIIHEIAHQWWYGVVGNNEIEMAWFDEGLAEYSTLLYYENYPEESVDVQKLVESTTINYDLYLDVVKSLNLDVNYSMELPLNQYSSEYEYVYMIYVKGLLFFHSLRATVGDEVFFKFLKSIYKEYKFKNISREGFVAVLENISKLDLAEFIEGWLSGKVDISQN